ncbi:protein disulfide-isomerase isoform X2 [Synchiropus splendidus]|uniref:protein disulfide-isomerase isoform X2 n=1 Tax=Synchiropus splendidus TaxID=270530 RepID=UPI00237D41AB|nr:protein disulfide-isomerase isoform X2 [Synchiropus splendidus]
MRGLLLLLLLGLFSLWTASALEDSVLRLRKGTFHSALTQHRQLLVLFHAPRSAEDFRVMQVFESTVAQLQGSEVKLATVDVTEEKELAKELNATRPPSIRLYLSGDKHKPIPCPVPQTPASILTWLKRRAGSPADLISERDQSEASDELQVLGFFKDLSSDYVQLFYSAAIDLPDIVFALTQDDDIINKYGVTPGVVLLLRQSKLVQALQMDPDTSKEDLIVFINVYEMDPVTEYSGQTATRILSSPVLNHILLFANKSVAGFEELYSAFNSAAEDFRMEIVFVLVNIDEPRNGRLMEYFRVRPFDAPHVRLVNLTDHMTYHLPTDTLDVATIKTFCRSYLDGEAKPKLQSQPIPDGWEQQPVKELVGSTLEKVAFQPNKTVFVLFYLPYGKESGSLFPLWEELAATFKDQEDVVIARIDASANEVDLTMQQSYPWLCLFPALYSERVVLYSGKKELKDLVQFIHREMDGAKVYRQKEDEERRRYMEELRAEEARHESKTRDEL